MSNKIRVEICRLGENIHIVIVLHDDLILCLAFGHLSISFAYESLHLAPKICCRWCNASFQVEAYIDPLWPTLSCSHRVVSIDSYVVPEVDPVNIDEDLVTDRDPSFIKVLVDNALAVFKFFEWPVDSSFDLFFLIGINHL